MAEEAAVEAVPTKDEMTELLNEDAVSEEVVGEVSEETSEYSEAEQQAMEKGWSPEGVEGKLNLSAEEFLDRQSLYDDIHSLKRQNKTLKGDIDNINKYQQDIRADERKKVVAELKTQKKEALDDGDHDREIEIDEQLADERDKAKTEKEVSATNEDFEDWVTDNSWYQDDTELRSEADVYGEVYWTKNPEKSREEVYTAVTKYIKRSFKEKFENTNRSKPAAVEANTSSARKGKGKAKHTVKDLDAEAKSVMRTIVRTSDMTEEQFVKEYFARNGK